MPLLLTTSRIYETGVKLLSADKRRNSSVSAFDIERKNVYVPESGIAVQRRRKDRVQGLRSRRRASIRSVA